MSKKVIVLADNSYTIRRIVELSFSEIENIEVRSFENGSGIKEKLLQLNPAVVIADIKLPEISGYDICRFVNETPSLAHSRVFLMKGSFEPIDNEMIENLKYEDIITKPFDSNALVNAVMKIINGEEKGLETGPAGGSPSTFPEEFPEIETETVENEDISFSDVRGEVEVPPAFERPVMGKPVLERDEIQPSEEITQGTQPLKDNLMLQEIEEPIKNPFDEEPAFEEINMSPPRPQPVPLELEQGPAGAPPTPEASKDASDEFHERFLEIANEDTSEDLLKMPLDAPLLSEGEEFPADAKGEPPVAENKLSLELEKTDLGSSAQTTVVDPAKMNFFAADRKEEAGKVLDLLESKAREKERPIEKSRPETLSPQDELARLTGMAKKEAKAEPVVPSAPGKFDLTGKVEEKLNQTIKELLWEIVPPLAEKIIKEEIEKIKSDLNDSSL